MNEKEREIAKVAEMEKVFDELENMVAAMEEQTERLFENEKRWKMLFDWYFNGTWQADHDLDENGYFSKRMKCGVLSEDGIYDVFCRLQDLKEEWMKISVCPNDNEKT